MAADGAWDVTADVERYDEATDWFLKRIVLTGADAHALDDRLKADAFWVGGGLHLSQVQRVFDKITTAIETGQSFEDWRKTVKTELKNGAHARLVFQNATQRAYNNGRWEQMHEPSTLRFRPYGMVDAILDGRTTEYCRLCNGTIELLSSPYWDTHWFPAHHFCRTCVRNLRKSEAAKRKAKPPVPGLDPPPGWGQSPRLYSQWKPDPAKHDSSLIAALNQKAAAGGTTKRKTQAPHHKTAAWKDTYAHYGEAASSLADGRASLERGLDLPVADVRNQLQRVGEMPGVKLMLDSIAGLDDGATLRARGGELDPIRKAAAGLGGHLERLTPRAVVTHPRLDGDFLGSRAMRFLSEATGPRVVHPDAVWRFFHGDGVTGSFCENKLKLIVFEPKNGALEHEWGHALEGLNPRLFRRAKAFLKARTAGEVPVDHGPNGMCREDDFWFFYVGRDYPVADTDELYGTEITSTALEQLVAGRAGSGRLAELVRDDPEHFLFLLGQLAGK